jgi:ribosome-associated toxin RatA of RatAB toxin-antitoxin module
MKYKNSLTCVSLILGMLFCIRPIFATPALDTISSVSMGEEAPHVTKRKKRDVTHLVATSMESIFKADDSAIWSALTDFKKYPTIFRHIQSVEIQKNDGELVYTESHLKPGIFVRNTIQHTVNDLSAAPKILNWQMLDGNFKYLKGKWELQEHTPSTCIVKYTLYVDFGPIVPAPLVNFVVHHMQEEIVADLKHYVETQYKPKDEKRSLSNASGY